MSDGAAAVLLMTRAEAMRRGLPVLGIFRSFAAVGVDPAVMGVGPAVAIPAALAMAGLATDDVDVFELNEAFASQVQDHACRAWSRILCLFLWLQPDIVPAWCLPVCLGCQACLKPHTAGWMQLVEALAAPASGDILLQQAGPGPSTRQPQRRCSRARPPAGLHWCAPIAGLKT